MLKKWTFAFSLLLLFAASPFLYSDDEIVYQPGVLDFSFDTGSDPGQSTSYSFNVYTVGPVLITAQWYGSAPALTLLLSGPGTDSYYARIDGPAPLVMNFYIPEELLSLGTTWQVTILNLTGYGGGFGRVYIQYPVPAAPVLPPVEVGEHTHGPGCGHYYFYGFWYEIPFMHVHSHWCGHHGPDVIIIDGGHGHDHGDGHPHGPGWPGEPPPWETLPPGETFPPEESIPPSESVPPSDTTPPGPGPTLTVWPTFTFTFPPSSPPPWTGPTFTIGPTFTFTFPPSSPPWTGPTFTFGPTLSLPPSSPPFTIPTFTLGPTVSLPPTFTFSPSLTPHPTWTLSPTLTFGPTISPTVTLLPTFTVKPTFSLKPTLHPTFGPGKTIPTFSLKPTFKPGLTVKPSKTIPPFEQNPGLTIAPVKTFKPIKTYGLELPSGKKTNYTFKPGDNSKWQNQGQENHPVYPKEPSGLKPVYSETPVYTAGPVYKKTKKVYPGIQVNEQAGSSVKPYPEDQKYTEAQPNEGSRGTYVKPSGVKIDSSKAMQVQPSQKLESPVYKQETPVDYNQGTQTQYQAPTDDSKYKNLKIQNLDQQK